jgi:hypothetical protein
MSKAKKNYKFEQGELLDDTAHRFLVSKSPEAHEEFFHNCVFFLEFSIGQGKNSNYMCIQDSEKYNAFFKSLKRHVLNDFNDNGIYRGMTMKMINQVVYHINTNTSVDYVSKIKKDIGDECKLPSSFNTILCNTSEHYIQVFHPWTIRKLTNQLSTTKKTTFSCCAEEHKTCFRNRAIASQCRNWESEKTYSKTIFPLKMPFCEKKDVFLQDLKEEISKNGYFVLQLAKEPIATYVANWDAYLEKIMDLKNQEMSTFQIPENNRRYKTQSSSSHLPRSGETFYGHYNDFTKIIEALHSMVCYTFQALSELPKDCTIRYETGRFVYHFID